MRITKMEAAKIADQLLQKKKDVFSEKMKQLELKVQEEWAKTIPNDVKECIEKHRSFFGFGTRFYTGIISSVNGGNPRDISFTLFPAKYNEKYYRADDFNDHIIGLVKECSDLHMMIDKTKNELIEYIYRLATPEKIKAKFPEVTITDKSTKAVTLINDEVLQWLKK
jgi:hypothetical protein